MSAQEWEATIRAALGKLPGHWHYHERALAALSALLAALKQAESDGADYAGYGEILETLTQERDAALARSAALEEALREIADAKPGGRGGQFAFGLQRIARRALASSAGSAHDRETG